MSLINKALQMNFRLLAGIATVTFGIAYAVYTIVKKTEEDFSSFKKQDIVQFLSLIKRDLYPVYNEICQRINGDPSRPGSQPKDVRLYLAQNKDFKEKVRQVEDRVYSMHGVKNTIAFEEYVAKMAEKEKDVQQALIDITDGFKKAIKGDSTITDVVLDSKMTPDQLSSLYKEALAESLRNKIELKEGASLNHLICKMMYERGLDNDEYHPEKIFNFALQTYTKEEGFRQFLIKLSESEKQVELALKDNDEEKAKKSLKELRDVKYTEEVKEESSKVVEELEPIKEEKTEDKDSQIHSSFKKIEEVPEETPIKESFVRVDDEGRIEQRETSNDKAPVLEKLGEVVKEQVQENKEKVFEQIGEVVAEQGAENKEKVFVKLGEVVKEHEEENKEKVLKKLGEVVKEHKDDNTKKVIEKIEGVVNQEELKQKEYTLNKMSELPEQPKKEEIPEVEVIKADEGVEDGSEVQGQEVELEEDNVEQLVVEDVKVEANVEVKEEPEIEIKQEVTVEPKEEVTVEPKEEVNDEPKEEVTVEPKEEVNDEPKEEVNDEPKEEVNVEPEVDNKEEPEKEVNDEPKEEVNVEPKEDTKEDVNVEPKEDIKEEAKELPKEEVKEEPKEQTTTLPKEELKEEPKQELKQDEFLKVSLDSNKSEEKEASVTTNDSFINVSTNKPNEENIQKSMDFKKNSSPVMEEIKGDGPGEEPKQTMPKKKKNKKKKKKNK